MSGTREEAKLKARIAQLDATIAAMNATPDSRAGDWVPELTVESDGLWRSERALKAHGTRGDKVRNTLMKESEKIPPEIHAEWKRAASLFFAPGVRGSRSYGSLPIGDYWMNAPIVPGKEHYVITPNGDRPIGCVIAGDLIDRGIAVDACCIEAKFGLVKLDRYGQRIEPTGALAEAIAYVLWVNDGKPGGFPDAIGVAADGTYILREAKTLNDRLKWPQVRLMDGMRRRSNADVKVVKWG